MELFAPPYINHQRSWYNGLTDHPCHLGINNVINADVIIGNLSANCKGNGICKMLPRGSFAAQCSTVKSTLVKRAQKQLDIVFYTQACCPSMYRRAFANGEFIVEASFRLPDWVRKTLSFQAQPQIPAGSYPMLKLKECALVRFQLD